MKKNLIIFDFDNTLVVSDSEVVVIKPDGRRIGLDPYQYAKYTPEPGDEMDYSQFEEVINPKTIEKYHRIMKAAIKSPAADVMILTARGSTEGISSYLTDNGIRPEDVEVVGLGTGSPAAKADRIKQSVKRGGYSDVYFFDDSEHNDEAVRGLKDIGARIHSHLVPQHHYRPLASKQPKTFNPDHVGKNLNRRISNPETGNNILVKTALKYPTNHPAHKIARRLILRHHRN